MEYGIKTSVYYDKKDNEVDLEFWIDFEEDLFTVSLDGKHIFIADWNGNMRAVFEEMICIANMREDK